MSKMHTKSSVTPPARRATSTNILSKVKHLLLDCLCHCRTSQQRNTFKQNTINRHAFARLRLMQRGYKHGHNYIAGPPQSKRRPRGCSENKRHNTSIWDRWKNDVTYRTFRFAINWSGAWVRYLDHIAKSISPMQRRTCKGIDTAIYFTCGASTKISKRHLYHKDQDTKAQRKHWLMCTSKSDPSAQRCLQWLSINWAEYSAEEQPQPTSSSPWTPRSYWWASSSWTSDWHQHERKDSVWSEKWQGETSTLVSSCRSWH